MAAEAAERAAEETEKKKEEDFDTTFRQVLYNRYGRLFISRLTFFCLCKRHFMT